MGALFVMALSVVALDIPAGAGTLTFLPFCTRVKRHYHWPIAIIAEVMSHFYALGGGRGGIMRDRDLVWGRDPDKVGVEATVVEVEVEHTDEVLHQAGMRLEDASLIEMSSIIVKLQLVHYGERATEARKYLDVLRSLLYDAEEATRKSNQGQFKSAKEAFYAQLPVLERIASTTIHRFHEDEWEGRSLTPPVVERMFHPVVEDTAPFTNTGASAEDAGSFEEEVVEPADMSQGQLTEIFINNSAPSDEGREENIMNNKSGGAGWFGLRRRDAVIITAIAVMMAVVVISAFHERCGEHTDAVARMSNGRAVAEATPTTTAPGTATVATPPMRPSVSSTTPKDPIVQTVQGGWVVADPAWFADRGLSHPLECTPTRACSWTRFRKDAVYLNNGGMRVVLQVHDTTHTIHYTGEFSTAFKVAENAPGLPIVNCPVGRDCLLWKRGDAWWAVPPICFGKALALVPASPQFAHIECPTPVRIE